MQGEMIVGQALQNYLHKDLTYKVLESCWQNCYHDQVDAKELAKGEIEKDKLRQMNKCHSRCISRHFEVMKMLNDTREQRERDLAMGLPPGTSSAQ
jgi:hypothetical protein